MPKSEEQNQRIKDERRLQIIQAGLKVFARKGLAAAKISEIAATAGLSHGLVYHYYPGKEALYTTILELALGGTLDTFSKVIAYPGRPWERLTLLCEKMLEGVRENPEYVLFVIQTMVTETVPKEAKTILEGYSPKISGGLSRLIREGQKTGEVIAGDPLELAAVFFSTVQGLALSTMSGWVAPESFPKVETVLRLLKA